ncbi:maleylpyruvate isomerase family mycothiol-dependent enzyme [Gordonia sp. PKS22-38]|uniref:Maleylpyruvate isomerase family mycothiol-dependent enzyme n=1 Tax=Gordonia prachuapensis TaxID=3115651 RepID=A0ABU7MWY5_9ACTN|nr:maleylpyruvate isomerase family mycothiol-dependent enzyme [Gordonia sp. PKS22-38]
MNTTARTPSQPRPAALQHDLAMGLAATEYRRVVELLQSLTPEQWVSTTDCPGWTVRDMSAHMLGMVEMAATLREQRRQMRTARRRKDGLFIDALTALQIEERRHMRPEQIIDSYAQRAPKAVRGRTRTPGLIRRRTLGVPGEFGGEAESWTTGYLTDVILTRDPWMHRIDIARATGAEHTITADHDGVLVADVVAEWAARHGRPFSLNLTGPAGGHWSHGRGGPEIELDAIEFTRILSGRTPGNGLLTTLVPF